MINSIKHFEEKSINIFENLEKNFFENPTDFFTFVNGITKELYQLGRMILQESLEEMNQMLIDSGVRKQSWIIEKHSNKQLITSLGTISFRKTLFTNRQTGESSYLLDQVLGLAPHERMTEDAEVRMLEEAVQTSYRRGGEASSFSESVSKQTVKNKLHHLQFPEEEKVQGKKRKAEYLYIDADEDHIALQFQEKKGDIARIGDGPKSNGMITKLVYIYEGAEPEAPRSRRYRLIHPYYFSGEAGSNEELWKRVADYIHSHYETEAIRKIFLNGDGAAWIKAGKKYLEKASFVLDEFHLSKAVAKMVRHREEDREAIKDEIYQTIRFGTKEAFREMVERLKEELPDQNGEKALEEGSAYIQNNWMAAKARVLHRERNCGCSAEGHVSHVLSSRMSSRPMGWSRLGAQKMAELRAYYYNKRSMLELVRYQKEEIVQVAGAEEIIYSLAQMRRSETRARKPGAKYVEILGRHLSRQMQKKVMFQHHIWDL